MLSTDQILRRLRTLREAKYLKQEYVARRMGIDRTTYIRKEKGYIPITTDEWLKLADAMDKEPAYFFSANSAAGQAGPDVLEEGERLLLELYRSLKRDEREDMACCLRLMLKGVKRKEVREALAEPTSHVGSGVGAAIV